jgi:hypothetical protein
MKSLVAVICCGVVFSIVGAASAEPVASVVAVRGKATVERGGRKLAAQPKLGIELLDTVATAEGGRAKLLFIDDSVLTLAEKSTMSIDTFVHSRSDRGKSLFNLLDGKMRAVVGKTRFEVKTPTVVAAARGTVILFDVGTINGKAFTRVTCLEGIVDVRSVAAAPGTKPVMLSPGQSIVVTAKQAPPASEQKSKSEKSSKSESKSELKSDSNSESKPEPNSESKSESKPEPNSESKSESKPDSKSESTSKPDSTSKQEQTRTTSTSTLGQTATEPSSTPDSAPATSSAAKLTLAPALEALPMPETLSPGEINKLKEATNTSGAEIKLPPPPAPVPLPPPPVIPKTQQQPKPRQPVKVDIGVKF